MKNCIKCQQPKEDHKLKTKKKPLCKACYMSEYLNIDDNRRKQLDSQKKHRENNPLRSKASLLRGALHTYSSNRLMDEYGYTREQFVEHIESLFKPDMNWENHGEVWEYDHIINITEMLRAGYSDNIINSLNNIRPLYRKENYERDKKHSIK